MPSSPSFSPGKLSLSLSAIPSSMFATSHSFAPNALSLLLTLPNATVRFARSGTSTGVFPGAYALASSTPTLSHRLVSSDGSILSAIGEFYVWSFTQQVLTCLVAFLAGSFSLPTLCASICAFDASGLHWEGSEERVYNLVYQYHNHVHNIGSKMDGILQ